MSKILVVVDMQVDFINGALGTEEAQKIFPRVRERLENLEERTRVIFTRDTHYDHYLATLEGQKLPVPHCIEGTTGWQIPEALTSLIHAPVIIDKPTFGSIKLMEVLRHWINFEFEECNGEITEIEFCGLCTDICVVSNVLMARAHFPNMKITVNSSLCAGTTPAAHKMALETMKSCQIDVI